MDGQVRSPVYSPVHCLLVSQVPSPVDSPLVHPQHSLALVPLFNRHRGRQVNRLYSLVDNRVESLRVSLACNLRDNLADSPLDYLRVSLQHNRFRSPRANPQVSRQVSHLVGRHRSLQECQAHSPLVCLPGSLPISPRASLRECLVLNLVRSPAAFPLVSLRVDPADSLLDGLAGSQVGGLVHSHQANLRCSHLAIPPLGPAGSRLAILAHSLVNSPVDALLLSPAVSRQCSLLLNQAPCLLHSHQQFLVVNLPVFRLASHRLDRVDSLQASLLPSRV